MNHWSWLILIIVLTLLLLHQFRKHRQIKSQLTHTSLILDDILAGNLDRRILDDQDALTAEICYKINQIVIQQKERHHTHEKAGQAYRQLATSLSHDLRTPLSSLSGYLEALESDLVAQEERAGYLNTARKKAEELKAYVDILFDWMKLESGERPYHFQRTDIYEQTRVILADWMLMLEEAGITADISIPEAAESALLDRDAYTRIIENLLQNTIRHSRATHCSIHLERRHNQFILTLSDNGKGIPQVHLNHIFSRLYKGDTARSSGGSGLGLSIVKEFVKAHGGTISVTSTPWNQTRFTVWLPAELSRPDYEKTRTRQGSGKVSPL